MKNNKIYFGCYKNSEHILTPCPFRENFNFKIGSMACQSCEDFIEIDKSEQWIKCSKLLKI